MIKHNVNGNTEGVRDAMLARLDSLYSYELEEGEFLPRELMKLLAECSCALNREIAVYITRDGEIVNVAIGTDCDVELTDFRLRRNANRLSCVRCVHTHPDGDGRLSDVDLSALKIFRYDAMTAVGVKDNEPFIVQTAFLQENAEVLVTPTVRWYKLPDAEWLDQILESDRLVGREETEENKDGRERAVLMGIESTESLEELARLAETAGAEVVGSFLQKREKPDSAMFIGKGRAEELARDCQALEADVCIFDEELTGIQVRNLEETLRVKVVDRTTLILDIFAGRASSAEGKLQVELAQLQYRSARLIGEGLVLSRLAGGIGTRGPGETQLETDRRHIRRKIQKLEEELSEVRKVRGTQRRRREKNAMPVVALVGYTNAGKSTLLNCLTGSDIPANDRLFDTLDTTTRRLKVDETQEILLSDTVGFIRKLPTHLIEAFKATLEELQYADVLLHVIDIANPEWMEQARVVDELIRQLGAESTPCIRVFNKCDAYFGILPHGEDIVCISAKSGEGAAELMQLLSARLDRGKRHVTIKLPYSAAALLDSLNRDAAVIKSEYTEDGIEVEAIVPPELFGRVKAYIPGYTEPKEDWET